MQPSHPRRTFSAALLLGFTALTAAPVLVAAPRGAAEPAPAVASALTNAKYSGRAFAAGVQLGPVGAPVFLCDTGELPTRGGCLSAALIEANVGVGALTCKTLMAQTDGGSGWSRSSAAAETIGMLNGVVRVGFARVESQVKCGTFDCRTELADLTILNQPIPIPPNGFPPNTQIPVPGVGTLVINEQKFLEVGSYKEVHVAALHLVAPLVADIQVLSAKSDLDCFGSTPPPGPCFDVLTGGGWLSVPGGKANFGFTVGFKADAGAPDGQFNLVDHANGLHIQALTITSYGQGGTPGARRFAGTCKVNGNAGFTFRCEAADNGEPGGGVDTMRFLVSNGYKAGGTLAGGNIQLHDACP
ncbi:MAG: hypothetical protein EPO68_04815 [Planctomycetota bacterium]|nr:MAG: hypothetical protein EPO68_04815 [Planctomycetota bacterium]